LNDKIDFRMRMLTNADAAPSSQSEIVKWSKQIVGIICCIEKVICKYSIMIEMLKSSGITLKAFINEHKLKQDQKLQQFNLTLKLLETKLTSFKKLYDHIKMLNENTSMLTYNDKNAKVANIKYEMQKIEHSLVDNDRADNLEFLSRDLNIAKFKTHIQNTTNVAFEVYNEFVEIKKETRPRGSGTIDVTVRYKQARLLGLKSQTEELLKNFTKYFYEFMKKYREWLNKLLITYRNVLEAEKNLKVYEKLIEENSNQIESDLNKKIDMITDFIGSQRSIVCDTHVSSPVQSFTKPIPSTKEMLKPFNTQKSKVDINSKCLPYTNSIGFESLIREMVVDTNNNSSSYTEVNSMGNSLAYSIQLLKNEQLETSRALEQNNFLLKRLQEKLLK